MQRHVVVVVVCVFVLVFFFNVVFIFHVHGKAICIKKWNYLHLYVKEFTSHAAPRWDGRRRSRTWRTENAGLPCDLVLVGTCALQTGSREPGRDVFRQWGCLWATVDTILKPIPSVTTTTTTNNNPLRHSTLMRVYPSNGDNLDGSWSPSFQLRCGTFTVLTLLAGRASNRLFSEESFTDSLLLLTRESDANLLLLKRRHCIARECCV